MTPTEKNALEALMLERECDACLYFIEGVKEDEEFCSRGIDDCILDEIKREEEAAAARLKDKRLYGCSECPYGKERPCVGFCFRKTKRNWDKRRKPKMR